MRIAAIKMTEVAEFDFHWLWLYRNYSYFKKGAIAPNLFLRLSCRVVLSDLFDGACHLDGEVNDANVSGVFRNFSETFFLVASISQQNGTERCLTVQLLMSATNS